MRGNAHVTGPRPPRMAQRERPAGPALSGMLRRRSGWRQRPSLLLGSFSQAREGCASATPCLCVTGDASFLRDLLQRGRGPFKLPPGGTAGGGPWGQRLRRGVDTCQPVHSPGASTLRATGPGSRPSTSATHNHTCNRPRPLSQASVCSPDLSQASVCSCLPSATAAFSNTQPHREPGALSVSAL